MTRESECPEHFGGEHFHIFDMLTGMYCWCGDIVAKIGVSH